MAECFCRIGDIELCYETFGDPSDPTALLVMGLATQMIGWPDEFCQALAGGLVRSLHPADEVLAAARALASEIASEAAPVSVALARRMMWTMLGAAHPMEAHRADSRAMFARGQSADAREGVESFLEKRPAQFSDRVSDGLPELFPGREEPAFR